MPITLIRNADLVVAWDASEKRHAYLPGGDVAWEGGALTFVGRNYAGPADEEIAGRGLMVMPGLVNIHSHPTSEPVPSRKDIERNYWGESVVHVIIGLAGEEADVRAWWIGADGFRAAESVVDG